MPPRPGSDLPAAAAPAQRALGDRAADVARLVARARRRRRTCPARRGARRRVPSHVAVPTPSAAGRRALGLDAQASTRRGRGRSVRQISTDGREPGAEKRIDAGLPSARGSSSGTGRLLRSGPIDSTRGAGGVGVEDDRRAARRPSAALAAQRDPRRGSSPSGARRPASSRPSHTARTSSRAPTLLAARPSSRTTSPSSWMIATSTVVGALEQERDPRAVACGRRGSASRTGVDADGCRCAAAWTSGAGRRRTPRTSRATRAAKSPRARRGHRRISSPLGTVHSWYVSRPRLWVCASAHADHAAVADDERRQRAGLGDVDERGDDALLLLGERLAAGEPRSPSPARPKAAQASGSSRASVLLVARPSQSPTSVSVSRSSTCGSSPIALADDLRGLAGAHQRARVERGEAVVARRLAERARLLAAACR